MVPASTVGAPNNPKNPTYKPGLLTDFSPLRQFRQKSSLSEVLPAQPGYSIRHVFQRVQIDGSILRVGKVRIVIKRFPHFSGMYGLPLHPVDHIFRVIKFTSNTSLGKIDKVLRIIHNLATIYGWAQPGMHTQLTGLAV